MANPHSKGKNRATKAKEFEETVIQIDRVTRVVKGGRRLRFRATVVIGNRKGDVGLGLGKSTEVTGAIQKAVSKAKRNMITVPLDGETIPHDINIKFKSSKILIIPAGPGTGIIAGGSVRKVLELAGIKNILSKSLGSSNRVNNAKATIEALKALYPNDRMKKLAASKQVTPAATTAAKAEDKKEEKAAEAAGK
ncbi:30S ribosomal protein S5 [Candidatus Peregrinibacteria bacterium CG11_big_fil_rev_8_21_14_0_20_41_10]|nr:MAG: 30S ribosomal protein S5 [Candidatus Peregrinibacteria bacterium CG11_big_fil_rev_8_21_14_0_20_41_10]PIZ76775.1 MAG: 30S ribosomal protein S5 [Candidatus Peregrinibacteria bacterium CG_4_10_14_0_2_um_filter_41_8]PJC37978.1 MAG: 30S ribosomal protein S5 [Candidatus Peregrinibacteria bacterium CG_4_9_14_0_2_um_filter_41_14]